MSRLYRQVFPPAGPCGQVFPLTVFCAVQREQKFKVWNDRFDDVVLRFREVAIGKLNYIHNNPLQDHWRLAANPEDYKYASASFYETSAQNALLLVHLMEYF